MTHVNIRLIRLLNNAQYLYPYLDILHMSRAQQYINLVDIYRSVSLLRLPVLIRILKYIYEVYIIIIMKIVWFHSNLLKFV